MPNQLIHETSPYLLQHANNPVNWYPWGPEALQKARDENKPVFLSIGYAACHWCHVMAHESFEDEETARLLNEHFISIKVDREERPDLDSIYMNAVVAMTGQGGWPMSMFLTPEGEPFYGGTYFPPVRRYGMPSFQEVLQAVTRAWQEDHQEIRRAGREVTQNLTETQRWSSAGQADLRPEVLEQATQALVRSYDWQNGGWGRAPRFPQPMTIEFLLMQHARGRDKCLEPAVHVLNRMSRGGMYDVIGGGFHRYSTDDRWLVPHFEKMLYDNGQLALVYLHAFQLTDDAWFRRVCVETLDFILRELTHPEGGFYSSLDADSEGEEGKYYVWSPQEIHQALGNAADRELFFQVYAVSEEGNFEGQNILQRRDDLRSLAQQLNLEEEQLIERLGALHHRLYQARQLRIRPATDDKVLVSWNALALRALAQAARTLGRADYLAAAQKNADFLLRALYADSRLLRAWRGGQARHSAFLEDHASLILALLDLYQSDFDPRWYAAAQSLAEDMQSSFRDPAGGFYDTRHDQDALITRPKDLQDNATPTGNSLAADALLRLAAYDDRAEWHAQAAGAIAALQDQLARYPTAFGQWLQAMDFAVGPVRQIALVGDPGDPGLLDLLAEVRRQYRPRTVTAASTADGDRSSGLALLRGRGLIQGRASAYVCQGFVCSLPVSDVEGLRQQLA